MIYSLHLEMDSDGFRFDTTDTTMFYYRDFNTWKTCWYQILCSSLAYVLTHWLSSVCTCVQWIIQSYKSKLWSSPRLSAWTLADDILSWNLIKTIVPKIKPWLKDVKTWMTNNFLLLNRSTTEVTVVGPKHLRMTLSSCLLTLDGISLTSNTSVNDLGVTIDWDLSFHSHIKQISK